MTDIGQNHVQVTQPIRGETTRFLTIRRRDKAFRDFLCPRFPAPATGRSCFYPDWLPSSGTFRYLEQQKLGCDMVFLTKYSAVR